MASREIRFFVCWLHLSYTIETKTLQIRGTKDKQIFDNTVQNDCRE